MLTETILVDANVIIDCISSDPTWVDWSLAKLQESSESANLVTNQIVLAEILYGEENDIETANALFAYGIDYLSIPFAASLPAAQAFEKYKKRGGTKSGTLPDFLIGAHAEVSSLTILTRDVTRYQSYFPTVPIISP